MFLTNLISNLFSYACFVRVCSVYDCYLTFFRLGQAFSAFDEDWGSHFWGIHLTKSLIWIEKASTKQD